MDERPQHVGIVRLGKCIESLELPGAPLEVASTEALFLAFENVAREQHLWSVMPKVRWHRPGK